MTNYIYVPVDSGSEVLHIIIPIHDSFIHMYQHVVTLMFHHQRRHVNSPPFQPGAKYCFGCVCKTGEEMFLQNRKLDVGAHFVFSILLILQTPRKFLAVRVCQVAATAQERQHQHVVAASKLHSR